MYLQNEEPADDLMKSQEVTRKDIIREIKQTCLLYKTTVIDNIIKMKSNLSLKNILDVTIYIDTKYNFDSNCFWEEHKLRYPLISKLALILVNIPASSAQIERFFSISGIISSSRRANMNDDFLIDEVF